MFSTFKRFTASVASFSLKWFLRNFCLVLELSRELFSFLRIEVRGRLAELGYHASQVEDLYNIDYMGITFPRSWWDYCSGGTLGPSMDLKQNLWEVKHHLLNPRLPQSWTRLTFSGSLHRSRTCGLRNWNHWIYACADSAVFVPSLVSKGLQAQLPYWIYHIPIFHSTQLRLRM